MAEKKCRSNGEGSIRQRKDGRYEARVTTGFDLKTDKPVCRSIYGRTKKKCDSK